MFDSPEAQFAIEAVREASLLARRIQREMVGSGAHEGRPLAGDGGRLRRPGPRCPAAGRATCPASTLIGEEQADALRLEEGVATLDQITEFVRTAIPDATPEEVCGLIDRGSGEPGDTFWTLDPIDGTKGFLRREQYAVALALVRNGKVELGVLGCPELRDGRQRIARRRRRGQGTWTQPLDGSGDWQRLNVSIAPTTPKTPAFLRSVEKVAHERRRNRPARGEARRHRAARRHG